PADRTLGLSYILTLTAKNSTLSHLNSTQVFAMNQKSKASRSLQKTHLKEIRNRHH
ncbi:unnamed protein product, partial [Urochloa humidicola]